MQRSLMQENISFMVPPSPHGKPLPPSPHKRILVTGCDRTDDVMHETSTLAAVLKRKCFD